MVLRALRRRAKLSRLALSFLGIAVASIAPLQAAPIPKTLEHLEFVEHLPGGSGGVYVVQDPDTGVKYTLKVGAHSAGMQEEMMADSLYQALGVPVPDFRLFGSIPEELKQKAKIPEGAFYRLSEFIEGKLLKDIPADQQARAEAQVAKHFVADALLSNWDAVVGGRNIQIDPAGKPYRIDNGGSLRYRAKGEPKATSGVFWDPRRVTELATLKHSKISPDGARIFGKLSAEEITTQIRDVLSKRSAILRKVKEAGAQLKMGEKSIEELYLNLLARLDHLALLSRRTPWVVGATLEPATGASGAGVLTYTLRKGVPMVLLGKRKGGDVARFNGTWSNFGGKSDVAPSEHPDRSLAHTASRELAEESAGTIHLSPSALNNSYSFDLVPNLVEVKGDGHAVANKILYRTYIAQIPDVPADQIMAAAKASQKSTDQEYTDFMWVPMSQLIRTAKDSGSIGFRVKRKDAEGIDEELVQIYYPLLQTLSHPHVVSTMENIVKQAKSGKTVITKPASVMHVQGIYRDDQRFRSSQANQLKIEWEKVEAAAPGERQHRVVPAGENAAGKKMSIRQWLLMGKKMQSQEVHFDPRVHEKQLADAVAQHGVVMGELKERWGISAQPQKPVDELLPPRTPEQEAEMERIQKEMVSAPYSQTEGFMKTMLGARYIEIPSDATKAQARAITTANLKEFILDPSFNEKAQCFIDEKRDHPGNFDAYISALTDALMEERRNKDKVVFYHATGAKLAFIFDYVSELRRQLRIQGGNQTYLRALDKAFEKYPTIDAFVKGFTQEGQISNYSGDYADMGLSVNPFLTGNAHRYGSCTFFYFFDEKANFPPDLDQFYKHLKKHLGTGEHITDLERIFKHHLEADKRNHARLVQIFVDPRVVDQVSYSSIVRGDLLPIKLSEAEPKYYGTLKVVTHALQGSPTELADVLKDQKSNWTKVDPQDVQARLFMHPHYFYHPDLTKIVNYSLPETNPGKRAAAQKELKSFVKAEVSNMLANEASIPPETVQTGMGIRDLHAQVLKSTMGRQPRGDTRQSSIGELIEQDDLEGLKRALDGKPFVLINPIQSIHNHLRVEGLLPLEVAVRSGSFRTAEYLLKTYPPKGVESRSLFSPYFFVRVSREPFLMSVHYLQHYDEIAKFPGLSRALMSASLANDDSAAEIAQFWAQHPEKVNPADLHELLLSRPHMDPFLDKKIVGLLSLDPMLDDDAFRGKILAHCLQVNSSKSQRFCPEYLDALRKRMTANPQVVSFKDVQEFLKKVEDDLSGRPSHATSYLSYLSTKIPDSKFYELIEKYIETHTLNESERSEMLRSLVPKYGKGSPRSFTLVEKLLASGPDGQVAWRAYLFEAFKKSDGSDLVALLKKIVAIAPLTESEETPIVEKLRSYGKLEESVEYLSSYPLKSGSDLDTVLRFDEETQKKLFAKVSKKDFDDPGLRTYWLRKFRHHFNLRSLGEAEALVKYFGLEPKEAVDLIFAYSEIEGKAGYEKETAFLNNTLMKLRREDPRIQELVAQRVVEMRDPFEILTKVLGKEETSASTPRHSPRVGKTHGSHFSNEAKELFYKKIDKILEAAASTARPVDVKPLLALLFGEDFLSYKDLELKIARKASQYYFNKKSVGSLMGLLRGRKLSVLSIETLDYQFVSAYHLLHYIAQQEDADFAFFKDRFQSDPHVLAAAIGALKTAEEGTYPEDRAERERGREKLKQLLPRGVSYDPKFVLEVMKDKELTTSKGLTEDLTREMILQARALPEYYSALLTFHEQNFSSRGIVVEIAASLSQEELGSLIRTLAGYSGYSGFLGAFEKRLAELGGDRRNGLIRLIASLVQREMAGEWNPKIVQKLVSMLVYELKAYEALEWKDVIDQAIRKKAVDVIRPLVAQLPEELRRPHLAAIAGALDQFPEKDAEALREFLSAQKYVGTFDSFEKMAKELDQKRDEASLVKRRTLLLDKMKDFPQDPSLHRIIRGESAANRKLAHRKFNDVYEETLSRMEESHKEAYEKWMDSYYRPDPSDPACAVGTASGPTADVLGLGEVLQQAAKSGVSPGSRSPRSSAANPAAGESQ